MSELFGLLLKYGGWTYDVVKTAAAARLKGLTEAEIAAEVARIKARQQADNKADWDVVSS